MQWAYSFTYLRYIHELGLSALKRSEYKEVFYLGGYISGRNGWYFKKLFKFHSISSVQDTSWVYRAQRCVSRGRDLTAY